MTQLRAVIYARYSSDLQREESIEDQVRLCRERAAAEGWLLGECYSDMAQSGSTSFRPRYQQMLLDARAGKFDIVLAESLDRLTLSLTKNGFPVPKVRHIHGRPKIRTRYQRRQCQ